MDRKMRTSFCVFAMAGDGLKRIAYWERDIEPSDVWWDYIGFRHCVRSSVDLDPGHFVEPILVTAEGADVVVELYDCTNETLHRTEYAPEKVCFSSREIELLTEAIRRRYLPYIK